MGKDIQEKGIPFQIAAISGGGELADTATIMEDLLDHYPDVVDPFLKKSLGVLLTRLQFFFRRSTGEGRSVERSTTVFRQCARHGIRINPRWALLATGQPSLSQSDFDFYDALGRANFIDKAVALAEGDAEMWGRLPDGFSAELARGFLLDPQRKGLLQLLSFCPPSSSSKNPIPLELLGEAAFSETPLQLATLVIRLDELGWTDANASSVARATAQALEKRPDVVERVCNVLEKATGTSRAKDALLMALLRELPDNAWQIRGRVVETLNVLLARRGPVSLPEIV